MMLGDESKLAFFLVENHLFPFKGAKGGLGRPAAAGWWWVQPRCLSEKFQEADCGPAPWNFFARGSGRRPPRWLSGAARPLSCSCCVFSGFDCCEVFMVCSVFQSPMVCVFRFSCVGGLMFLCCRFQRCHVFRLLCSSLSVHGAGHCSSLSAHCGSLSVHCVLHCSSLSVPCSS